MDTQLRGEPHEESKLPRAFYDDIILYWKDWKMENHRGNKPKYLTIERFEKFVSNDFHHLQSKVALNSKLLWAILGGLIVAALVDRLVG